MLHVIANHAVEHVALADAFRMSRAVRSFRSDPVARRAGSRVKGETAAFPPSADRGVIEFATYGTRSRDDQICRPPLSNAARRLPRLRADSQPARAPWRDLGDLYPLRHRPAPAIGRWHYPLVRAQLGGTAVVRGGEHLSFDDDEACRSGADEHAARGRRRPLPRWRVAACWARPARRHRLPIRQDSRIPVGAGDAPTRMAELEPGP